MTSKRPTHTHILMQNFDAFFERVWGHKKSTQRKVPARYTNNGEIVVKLKHLNRKHITDVTRLFLRLLASIQGCCKYSYIM